LMGSRGPLSQSKRLKLSLGSARANRAGRAEDERPASIRPFAPPPHLAGEARLEWDRLEPVLRPQGLLREEFLSLFAGYCSAVGAAREAEALLAEVKKPAQRLLWGGLARKCWAQAQRLGSEFGLTPAARARAGIDNRLPKQKSRNPFADIG
ncbi:MAG: P27 family phage terminase small subunit, partial [Gemmatimonadales bacterium]|nr:P27 family phage terminase small subunit [Gemmatimonadales bacterium]